MTKNQRNRDSAVMMSSVMPSVKYSCSGSPLMLTNGRTAIEGFSDVMKCAAGVANGDAIDAHRPSDVLQILVPEVLAVENQLAGDVLANALRYAQAAGFGDPIQPCNHVDSVTEDVTVLDDDVALMYPDAKGHRQVRRDAGIAWDHCPLYFDRALDGFDHAGELDQHPVAGRLDHAPVMLSDLRVDKLASVGPEGGKRPRLVDAHEATVAYHVGGQDGSEFTFNFLCSHGIPQRSVGRLV